MLTLDNIYVDEIPLLSGVVVVVIDSKKHTAILDDVRRVAPSNVLVYELLDKEEERDEIEEEFYTKCGIDWLPAILLVASGEVVEIMFDANIKNINRLMGAISLYLK